MHSEIRGSTKTKHWIPFLNRVVDDIGRMDKLAHPSEQPLNQTLSDFTPRVKAGASFNAEMAFQALHDGANAIRILLMAFSQFVPMPEDWHVEMKAVIVAHNTVSRSFRSRDSSVSNQQVVDQTLPEP